MRIFPAVSALLISVAAWADVTGTITGVVTDPTGAVVPNSEIVAVNTGTNARFRAVSDAQGSYFLRALPVGVYGLAVTQPGFRKFETKDVRLQVNEVVRVD
ncbi:MAG: carboxypeptidase-like regulatory domain-containing protein, partial [Bryobacteraceae bacterium]